MQHEGILCVGRTHSGEARSDALLDLQQAEVTLVHHYNIGRGAANNVVCHVNAEWQVLGVDLPTRLLAEEICRSLR